MSVKINYTYGCWIVIHNKTNSLHFIAWVITFKIVELIVKFCQANFIYFFIIFYWKCLLNWTVALRWTSAFTHDENMCPNRQNVWMCQNENWTHVPLQYSMYCYCIFFAVVHSSTKRVFLMFCFWLTVTVGYCIFLLHNVVVLWREYTVKMWNIHIQCLVLTYSPTVTTAICNFTVVFKWLYKWPFR